MDTTGNMEFLFNETEREDTQLFESGALARDQTGINMYPALNRQDNGIQHQPDELLLIDDPKFETR